VAALGQVAVIVVTAVIANLFCCSAHGILILSDQFGIFDLFVFVEFDGAIGFGKCELELVNASSCRRLVSTCWVFSDLWHMEISYPDSPRFALPNSGCHWRASSPTSTTALSPHKARNSRQLLPQSS